MIEDDDGYVKKRANWNIEIYLGEKNKIFETD